MQKNRENEILENSKQSIKEVRLNREYYEKIKEKENR